MQISKSLICDYFKRNNHHDFALEFVKQCGPLDQIRDNTLENVISSLRNNSRLFDDKPGLTSNVSSESFRNSDEEQGHSTKFSRSFIVSDSSSEICSSSDEEQGHCLKNLRLVVSDLSSESGSDNEQQGLCPKNISHVFSNLSSEDELEHYLKDVIRNVESTVGKI